MASLANETAHETTFRPITVRVLDSNRSPGKPICIVGKQLCFFEKEGRVPEIGEYVDIMITRPLRGQTGLTAVLVQPIDLERHTLVRIRGFECAGTMATTTARGVTYDIGQITEGREDDRGHMMLVRDYTVWPRVVGFKGKTLFDTNTYTPGRSCPRYVDNVNRSLTDMLKPEPMWIWVDNNVPTRCHGVNSMEDTDYFHLVRQ